jgi:hypothetical protein
MICKMIMDGVRDPYSVAEILQSIVTEVKVYLHRLFETEIITVSATDGTETFASSGIFTGGVYGETLPIGVGKPTMATNATVHEMIEDGKFTELFGSLGERKCWQESQVVQFCRERRDKLRTDGFGTFLELEGSFVADVYVSDDGRLKVLVRKFLYDYVWFARCHHRVVVPQ